LHLCRLDTPPAFGRLATFYGSVTAVVCPGLRISNFGYFGCGAFYTFTRLRCPATRLHTVCLPILHCRLLPLQLVYTLRTFATYARDCPHTYPVDFTDWTRPLLHTHTFYRRCATVCLAFAHRYFTCLCRFGSWFGHYCVAHTYTFLYLYTFGSTFNATTCLALPVYRYTTPPCGLRLTLLRSFTFAFAVYAPYPTHTHLYGRVWFHGLTRVPSIRLLPALFATQHTTAVGLTLTLRTLPDCLPFAWFILQVRWTRC